MAWCLINLRKNFSVPYESRHSSVFIAITLGAGQIEEFGVRFSAGERYISLLDSVQTGSEAYLLGTGGIFLVDKAVGT
jgi:hypothetical protein